MTTIAPLLRGILDYAGMFPPAGLPSVITVTGSTNTDRDAGLNYGRCVDLYAPGEDITSAWYTSNAAAATISGSALISSGLARSPSRTTY